MNRNCRQTGFRRKHTKWGECLFGGILNSEGDEVLFYALPSPSIARYQVILSKR